SISECQRLAHDEQRISIRCNRGEGGRNIVATSNLRCQYFQPEGNGCGPNDIAFQPVGEIVAVEQDRQPPPLILVGGAESSQAFRWGDGAMTGLGSLPGDTNSAASGVNANGRVVVGESFNATAQAFRWVNGTMTDLGFLPGGTASVAFGVSANGKVVVGVGISAEPRQAFRWTAATGMQSVKALLQAAGVAIPGWQLGEASAVSAEGTTIVGNGRDPNGRPQAWIADLSDLCFAEGMLVLRLNDDGNPVFLRARCKDDDGA